MATETKSTIAEAPLKRFTWLATIKDGDAVRKLDGYVDAADEAAARKIIEAMPDLKVAAIQIPNPNLEK